jgi:hypothetical protein
VIGIVSFDSLFYALKQVESILLRNLDECHEAKTELVKPGDHNACVTEKAIRSLDLALRMTRVALF